MPYCQEILQIMALGARSMLRARNSLNAKGTQAEVMITLLQIYLGAVNLCKYTLYIAVMETKPILDTLR